MAYDLIDHIEAAEREESVVDDLGGAVAVASTTTPQVKAPTEKQLLYARDIAQAGKLLLPWSVQQDRRALSAWIDAHKKVLAGNPDAQRRKFFMRAKANSAAKPSENRLDALPSAKQIALAERLARKHRRDVPDICYKDKTSMSRWIDSHIR